MNQSSGSTSVDEEFDQKFELWNTTAQRPMSTSKSGSGDGPWPEPAFARGFRQDVEMSAPALSTAKQATIQATAIACAPSGSSDDAAMSDETHAAAAPTPTALNVLATTAAAFAFATPSRGSAIAEVHALAPSHCQAGSRPAVSAQTHAPAPGPSAPLLVARATASAASPASVSVSSSASVCWGFYINPTFEHCDDVRKYDFLMVVRFRCVLCLLVPFSTFSCCAGTFVGVAANNHAWRHLMSAV